MATVDVIPGRVWVILCESVDGEYDPYINPIAHRSLTGARATCDRLEKTVESAPHIWATDWEMTDGSEDDPDSLEYQRTCEYGCRYTISSSAVSD